MLKYLDPRYIRQMVDYDYMPTLYVLGVREVMKHNQTNNTQSESDLKLWSPFWEFFNHDWAYFVLVIKTWKRWKQFENESSGASVTKSWPIC